MTPIEEIDRLVSAFLADPLRSGDAWREIAEAGAFVNLLSALVEGVAAGTGVDLVHARACLEKLRSADFDDAIGTYYRERALVAVVSERLARNAAGLFSSAIIAALANEVSSLPATERSAKLLELRWWADGSLAILRPLVGEAATVGPVVNAPNPSDPAWIIEDVFRDSDYTQAAASEYWSLTWLNRQQSAEAGRAIKFRIAAVDLRTHGGTLDHLHLTRLSPGPRGVLFEHPTSALVPLGGFFISALEKAWRIGGAQSACWFLTGSQGPRDGNSCAGAAAVGFRKLVTGDTYLPSCLIVASLDDAGRFLPAAFNKEKLAEVLSKGIRTAVLGASPDGSPEAITPHDRDELVRSGLKIVFVSSLEEALNEASGYGLSGIGQLPEKLLDRYSALKEFRGTGNVRSWLAHDDDQRSFLLKMWPLDEGGTQDNVSRALWDRELRNLYRLSSSPAAERTLVVLHDAGLDQRAGCFVMILEAPGYKRLADALKRRNDFEWLTRAGQADPAKRREAWELLAVIAEGLETLHRYDLVHRNVAPENIFFEPDDGAPSARLGGFEWSVRFGGEVPDGAPPGHWHIPPDVAANAEHTISADDDWYAFGMVAARCFYSVENLGGHAADELNKLVFELSQAEHGQLTDYEVTLIQSLISPKRSDRMSFGYDIRKRIERILEILSDASSVTATAHRPLMLVFNHFDDKLVRGIVEATGLTFKGVVNGKEVDIRFNAYDPTHLRHLKECLYENFATRLIYGGQGRNRNQCLLVGARFNFLIAPFRDDALELDETWDIAFARAVFQLRRGESVSDIGAVPLQIEARRDLRPGQRRSWQPLLPASPTTADTDADLERLLDFLRCSNQIELAMRCTEVFPYRQLPVEHQDNQDGQAAFNVIRLSPMPMRAELVKFARSEGGMLTYFRSQWEAGGRSCDRVLVGSEKALLWRTPSEAEEWEISQITPEYIELRRPSDSTLQPPPAEGWVRSADFKGQVRLIKRRKDAIVRLEEHSYLLRALSAPKVIDTRQTGLPLADPITEGRIDSSKAAILQDIFRTRPIYALMGPPGTGKSTLVAHLLRQILEEDPVAQILVTAQAHGAVDVLRKKVQDEAFKDVARDEQPIMVRLGLAASGEFEPPPEGAADHTAKSLLKGVGQRLGADISDDLQREWLALAAEMANAASVGTSPDLAEFVELVRGGANVVFCTTSAADLEHLAKGERLFDWVIVEEAGKVHGCDLALSVQSGHRWMLLGDHKQLAPYREEDFRKAIAQLDDVIKVLDGLEGPDRQLVDSAWVDNWSDDPEGFKAFAGNWLRTFERVYEAAQMSRGRRTTIESVGAAAGMLSSQYRMHPTIGDLISHTFYEKGVESKTDDTLLHQFAEPAWMARKSLVWLDTRWAQHDSRFHEDRTPRYTNTAEVDEIVRFLTSLRFGVQPVKPYSVAVLSPYSRQSRLLHERLKTVHLPPGLEFKESLSARRGERSDPRRAHTVDSFQGNQADIVIVSLTRNNTYSPTNADDPEGRRRDEPSPLGFLSQKERLNVLLSRAERLLVLVGSWEFFEHQVEGVNTNMPSETYLWHWKKLLEFCEEQVGLNKAIRRSVVDDTTVGVAL